MPSPRLRRQLLSPQLLLSAFHPRASALLPTVRPRPPSANASRPWGSQLLAPRPGRASSTPPSAPAARGPPPRALRPFPFRSFAFISLLLFIFTASLPCLASTCWRLPSAGAGLRPQGPPPVHQGPSPPRPQNTANTPRAGTMRRRATRWSPRGRARVPSARSPQHLPPRPTPGVSAASAMACVRAVGCGSRSGTGRARGARPPPASVPPPRTPVSPPGPHRSLHKKSLLGS